jgi:hypothetical protein
MILLFPYGRREPLLTVAEKKSDTNKENSCRTDTCDEPSFVCSEENVVLNKSYDAYDTFIEMSMTEYRVMRPSISSSTSRERILQSVYVTREANTGKGMDTLVGRIEEENCLIEGL